MPMRPRRTSLPSSSTTASANTRWMSKPTTLTDLPSSPAVRGTGAGGQHGNYGSALAAHPGEPQGRPNKGSGSWPMVMCRPARTRVLPAPHAPDGLTIAAPHGRRRDIVGADANMADKGKVEALVKHARRAFLTPVPRAPSFAALNAELER